MGDPAMPKGEVGEKKCTPELNPVPIVPRPPGGPRCRQMLKYFPRPTTRGFVFRGRVRLRTAKALIHTDTLPFPKKTKALTVGTAIKAACRKDLPAHVLFEVCNHRWESNPWIQVADYCCWSVCRKWENANSDFYNRLKTRLAAPKIDPMSRGDGALYY